MAHISFDSSNLTKFVNPNELGEMQALVTAVDKELREGTGAGNDFRGFLNLPVDYDKEEVDKQTAEQKERNFNDIINYLMTELKEGDLVITLGCGDVYKLAKKLAKRLREDKP